MAKLIFNAAGLEVLEDAPVRAYAEVRICEAEALVVRRGVIWWSAGHVE